MEKISSIIRAVLKKRPKAQLIRSNNKFQFTALAYGVIIVTTSGYVKGLTKSFRTWIDNIVVFIHGHPVCMFVFVSISEYVLNHIITITPDTSYV